MQKQFYRMLFFELRQIILISNDIFARFNSLLQANKLRDAYLRNCLTKRPAQNLGQDNDNEDSFS